MSGDVKMATEFLENLYGNLAGGWVQLNHDTGGGMRSAWFDVATIDYTVMARCATALQPTSGVWIPVASRTAQLSEGKRGGAGECGDVVALVADIDHACAHHAKAGLPPTLADARTLLDDFPLPPTVLVQTGGGLQGWWMLNEPVPAADAERVVGRFGWSWSVRAARRGWTADNIGTVEHIARLPGTINRRAGQLATIVDADWYRRFSLDDLDQFTPEQPPPIGVRTQVLLRSSTGKQRADDPPGDWYNEQPGRFADLLLGAGCEARKSKDGRQHYCAPHHAGEHSPPTGIVIYNDPAGERAVIWSETFAGVLGVKHKASLDAFGLFARLHHGGDFAAAARAAKAERDGAHSSASEGADPHARAKGSADDPAEVVDPSKFFDKSGLLHASLRSAVKRIGPLSRGPGSTLWRYEHGVWLPDGEDEVRRRVSLLLGQRHRRSHADGIVADLKVMVPFITDDQPTRWINCRNGLLDWRTGELHDHDPEVPTTYQLAVDWNPTAACPVVDNWMADVAPDDAIDLVWEIVGNCVYPDQPFHRAVLLLGPGRNGKGTLLRLVGKLIGPRHISAVPLQALAENRFMVAELFGKVANVAGDLDARAIGRTDLFKAATGGDLLTGEHKHGQPFTFHSRATMLFSANEAPGSTDHTDGFFSRWVVIPFTRLQIAPGQEDVTIEAKMHAELEGVLVRAVCGLRRAMQQGRFSTPTSVTAATADYRENADPLRRFVDDCLEVTGDYADTVLRADVYARYRLWCETNGHKPFGANRFWSRLVAIDARIDPTRLNTGTRYVGGATLIASWT